MLKRILLVASLSFGAAFAAAEDAVVTASVYAETVGVNDNVQLTISVSGRDSGDASAPSPLPRLRGFRTVGGPSVGTPETVYRKTKEVALDVRALPEAGRPPQFTGAVGSFTLTSSLDRSSAETGDAVSLHAKLSGNGNLKMIGDLPLPPLPDFTIY